VELRLRVGTYLIRNSWLTTSEVGGGNFNFVGG